jgi:hypothetical protein
MALKDFFKGAAGGIVSGLGNIVGSIQNNKNVDKQLNAAREEAEKNRKWNSEEAQKSRDYATEMWNRNNAYNSASAQKSRLIEAGLNPDLMYGEGSTNVAASAPNAAQASGGSVADTSAYNRTRTFGDSVMQAGVQAMNYRLLNAQADKTDAEAKKIEAETEGTTTQNEWLPRLLAASLDKNEAEIDKIASDMDVNAASVRKIANDINESLTRIRGIEADIENKSVVQAQNWFKLNIDKSLSEAHVKQLASQTGLNNAQIRKIYALLPYEVQDLVSSASLKDSEAGLHFVEQGLVMLKQIAQKTQNQQLGIMVDSAKIDLDRKQALDESYRSSDGEYSTLSKAIFLLQDMVKSSIGTMFKK